MGRRWGKGCTLQAERGAGTKPRGEGEGAVFQGPTAVHPLETREAQSHARPGRPGLGVITSCSGHRGVTGEFESGKQHSVRVPEI